MTSLEIQQQINDWSGRLVALEEKATQAADRSAQLEKEREAFVLAAGLDDPTAQKELDALDARQAKAARKEKDLAAAVEQGKQKISSLQAELEAAQRGEAAGEISGLVARQLELCGEIEECAQWLTELLADSGEIARQIQSHIIPLDGDLESFLGPSKRTIQYIFARIRQFSPGGWEPGGTWKFEGGLRDTACAYWQGIGKRLGMALVNDKEPEAKGENEAA